MDFRVRLVGDRCPHLAGSSYMIAASESEELAVEVYQVIPETGAALCRSKDGRKFRAYAYGWSEETLFKLGKTTLPIGRVSEVTVFPDHGFEYVDFHRLEGKVGSQ